MKRARRRRRKKRQVSSQPTECWPGESLTHSLARLGGEGRADGVTCRRLPSARLSIQRNRMQQRRRAARAETPFRPFLFFYFFFFHSFFLPCPSDQPFRLFILGRVCAPWPGTLHRAGEYIFFKLVESTFLFFIDFIFFNNWIPKSFEVANNFFYNQHVIKISQSTDTTNHGLINKALRLEIQRFWVRLLAGVNSCRFKKKKKKIINKLISFSRS